MPSPPPEQRHPVDQPSGARDPGPARPLRDVLSQLADVIDTLDDDQYRTTPITTYGGSIGAHVRHCLDHVKTMLGGIAEGSIHYDDRQRGTVIETDRRAAMDAIADLDADLDRLCPADVDRPVQAVIMVTVDQPPVTTPSSIGRELAFVTSHTIHHGAMIGGMVKALGGRVPEDFGYAPSTIAHRSA